MKYIKSSNYSYNLHFIKTDRFKTITIKVNFKSKLKKEEITSRNMIVSMLCDSTLNYPSKRLLTLKTEDLYELNYRAMNYISGKYNIMTFAFTFLADEYTEKGNSDKCIEFIGDILFNPNIETKTNGIQFNQKSFDLSYKVLEDNIKTLKEMPDLYSKIRLMEYMEPNSLLSYRSCGYIEDLEKLTARKLYKYYKKMIESDILDIFIIGDINTHHMKKLIEKNFNIKTLKKPSESHFIIPKKARLIPKTYKENFDINQSKLVMGYKIDKTTDFEIRYVLNTLSYILGGGPDSKLFKTVREENSLCYSIYSTNNPLTSILTIFAGINASDYKKCVGLVKKEVRNIQKGMFTDEDIIKAKVTYINSLKELEDNPQNVISLYEGIEYLNSDTIRDRIIKINKVTKRDIIKLASKIHLDTVVLLEGNSNEES